MQALAIIVKGGWQTLMAANFHPQWPGISLKPLSSACSAHENHDLASKVEAYFT